MKVINYKYGYQFDCSINGKIQMTRPEYNQVVRYLYGSKIAKDSFWKKILYEDLARRVHTKRGFLVNVRVTATEMIAKKFGLKIKRDNYMLEVIN